MRYPSFKTQDWWTEANRENLNRDSTESSNNEVSKFMDENQNSQQDDYSWYGV
jgi:hypothetical protein